MQRFMEICQESGVKKYIFTFWPPLSHNNFHSQCVYIFLNNVLREGARIFLLIICTPDCNLCYHLFCSLCYHFSTLVFSYGFRQVFQSNYIAEIFRKIISGHFIKYVCRQNKKTPSCFRLPDRTWKKIAELPTPNICFHLKRLTSNNM